MWQAGLTSKKIVFIVNPIAGNGLTGRKWPLIHAMARDRLGSFTSYLTTQPWDAMRITRKNLMEGAEVIVCVGGDGTLNEVINGFMSLEQTIQTGASLGFVPHGTGCDFIRTVPIPAKIEQSLDTIKEGHVSEIDLGRLQYHDHQNFLKTRYFHNIISFGLGGEVDDRVNRSNKVLGPFISFFWSALVSIFFYGKKSIRLKVDDLFDDEVITWNVAVANGQYHGGGMRIAPDASTNDGLFHITVVGDLSLTEVLWNFPKLYNGRIKDIRNVLFLTGKKVEASSEQRVLLDVDGEQPGHLPVVIDIVPAALHMITKKS
ncbi:MAG: diacylglycerol kinase family lipid kinase [Bacteroidota bacterium]|nr:diacylglycerol kinase family lipid kinase [Bacteroidota bacterium]